MSTTRAENLTAERLVAEVEQGILDDDVETYMPAHLFGPPTSAELAAERTADPEVLLDDTGEVAAPTVDSTSGTIADGIAGGRSGSRPAKRAAQKNARGRR